MSYRSTHHIGITITNGMYFTVLTSMKYRMFYYIIITLFCFDLRVIPVKQSSHRYPHDICPFLKCKIDRTQFILAQIWLLLLLLVFTDIFHKMDISSKAATLVNYHGSRLYSHSLCLIDPSIICPSEDPCKGIRVKSWNTAVWINTTKHLSTRGILKSCQPL